MIERVRQAGTCVLLTALLAATLLLGACAPAETDESGAARTGPLTVVATTSMIADLAREVGGEAVAVTGLMGPGIDPHLYKASAGDVRRMAGADVILYNGLHLEGKMTEVFEQMRGRGIRTVPVAENLPDSVLLASQVYAGNYDPHVWFDVGLWQEVARYLGDVLGRIDTTHAAAYAARADAYVARLDTLDAYVHQRADEVPEGRRVLITSHDAFGYFGAAYGFEVRGLQGISTATEAGTADVQDLVAFVVDRRIPALFIETSVSPRGIRAVQEAVRDRGFEVDIGGTLYGDALGDPGTAAGTYTGMVRHNIDTIVAGLRAAGGDTTD